MKMTLYRSVFLGMISMSATALLCTAANLLCVLDYLTLDRSFATHGVLFIIGCLTPIVTFVLRMRAGNLYWDPAALHQKAGRLLALGTVLLMLIIVWTASFAVALLL